MFFFSSVFFSVFFFFFFFFFFVFLFSFVLPSIFYSSSPYWMHLFLLLSVLFSFFLLFFFVLSVFFHYLCVLMLDLLPFRIIIPPLLVLLLHVLLLLLHLLCLLLVIILLLPPNTRCLQFGGPPPPKAVKAQNAYTSSGFQQTHHTCKNAPNPAAKVYSKRPFLNLPRPERPVTEKKKKKTQKHYVLKGQKPKTHTPKSAQTRRNVYRQNATRPGF